jgi:hypothetical protein
VKSKDRFDLPEKYKMKTFPVSVDFLVPGFEQTHPPEMIKTLSSHDVEMVGLFEDFLARVESSIVNRQHFPVLRISDGEMECLFGRIWLNYRNGLKTRLHNFLRHLRDILVYKGGLNAFSIGIYGSGRYDRRELDEIRPRFFNEIIEVLRSGSLALHLNYQADPNCEQYFPKLDMWLQTIGIDVDTKNTMPFYFVYAMFASGRAQQVFSGKHICLVHSASREIREVMEANLKKIMGVGDISWLQISKERSFYDVIDLSNSSDWDAVFVGGGIGKANIFCQLSKFSGPIIDVGFFFEVWRDPENRFKRVYCATDDDWISRGVKNVWEAGI